MFMYTLRELFCGLMKNDVLTAIRSLILLHGPDAPILRKLGIDDCICSRPKNPLSALVL